NKSRGTLLRLASFVGLAGWCQQFFRWNCKPERNRECSATDRTARTSAPFAACQVEGNPAVLHIETPLLESRPLGLATGRTILLKMDALQPSGSFKLRGIGALCAHHARAGK